ncbi:DUF1501 domain-containing protein [Alienimonas sp. DA493]|uniref:DUF1501 domain-containing protein n=1 Tax=Alienimonas sp. DA493 TaxID=3373605 RepID=UPI00375449A1
MSFPPRLPHRRPVARRDALFGLGAGLGALAFTSLLGRDGRAAGPAGDPAAGPLAPKPAHHAAKAKRCIFLYMEGGPSHIDTFDPKPKLTELDGQEFRQAGKLLSGMSSGKRRYVGSPYSFRRHGQSGLWMCDRFEHLAGVADELCVYRGCHAESVNHPTANLHMNTGNRFGGDPAVGAWATYGLGSENENLPGFVILPDVYYPQAGSANWSNGFLPAHYQGTALRAQGSPILDLHPPAHMTAASERRSLDLLATLERNHAADHPQHGALAARMHNYELAFRMQAEVPDLLDVGSEPEHVRRLYGIGEGPDDGFARRCLLARRLVERGVRFVQAYAVGWDSHDDLERAHGARIRAVDRPVAGLIRDLKQRDLLKDTLVVLCGEFGRSPDNSTGRGRVGRDHNADAMTVLLAGGGVPAGTAVGATDELGAKAVETVHPIRDLHVTLLHLLGLDDNKLTYFHGGRYKQLSQTGGRVIGELIA